MSVALQNGRFKASFAATHHCHVVKRTKNWKRPLAVYRQSTFWPSFTHAHTTAGNWLNFKARAQPRSNTKHKWARPTRPDTQKQQHRHYASLLHIFCLEEGDHACVHRASLPSVPLKMQCSHFQWLVHQEVCTALVWQCLLCHTKLFSSVFGRNQSIWLA